MKEESEKTASTLGYNYPDSKWYKFSYDLIKQEKNDGNIFKKITNFF